MKKVFGTTIKRLIKLVLLLGVYTSVNSTYILAMLKGIMILTLPCEDAIPSMNTWKLRCHCPTTAKTFSIFPMHLVQDGFPLTKSFPKRNRKENFLRKGTENFPLLISTFLSGQEWKTFFCKYVGPKRHNGETTITSKSNESKKCKTKIWEIQVYQERKMKGESHCLIREMKLHDHTLFFAYFRMSPRKYE